MERETLIDEIEYLFGVAVEDCPPFLGINLTNYAPFHSNRDQLIEKMARQIGDWLQSELNTFVFHEMSINHLQFWW